MSEDFLELNPVTRITVGAVGRPGQRVFLLQASQQDRTISLKLEKEQVRALAKGIDTLFEELETQEIRPVATEDELAASTMDLEEPIEPLFIVGQIGLAFDGSTDMMVLVLQELVAEEGTEPATVRFWASLGQMRALSRHAKDLVAQGRPICPLCNRPMDPEGHFCPRRNGHSKRIAED